MLRASRPRRSPLGLISPSLAQNAPTPTASAPAPVPSSSRAPAASAEPRKQAIAFDLLGGPPSSGSRAAPSPAALSGGPAPPTPSPVAAAPAPSNGGGLFDLDFDAPAAPVAPAVKKDAKADILSLFSSAPPPRSFIPQQQQQQPPQQHGRQQSFGQGGLVGGLGGLNLGGGGQPDPWGNPVVAPQIQRQQSPPVAQGSTWGAFEGFQSPPATQAYQQQPQVCSLSMHCLCFACSHKRNEQPSSDLFGGGPPAANVWGAAPPAANAASDPFGGFSSGGFQSGGAKPKSDAFSDIWA